MATDNFNRSNESLDASASWTERRADWEVVSNQAGQPTTPNSLGCAKYDNSGLTDANYYVQCGCIPPSTSNGTFFGVIGRQADYSTDDSDGYLFWIRANVDTAYLYKRVSGSYTLLDSGAVTIDATEYAVRIEMDGTNLTGKVDGTTYATATDSAISAKGNGGLHNSTSDSAVRWDNYEQGDLVSGVTLTERGIGRGIMRGIGRGI